MRLQDNSAVIFVLRVSLYATTIPYPQGVRPSLCRAAPGQRTPLCVFPGRSGPGRTEKRHQGPTEGALGGIVAWPREKGVYLSHLLPL